MTIISRILPAGHVVPHHGCCEARYMTGLPFLASATSFQAGSAVLIAAMLMFGYLPSSAHRPAPRVLPRTPPGTPQRFVPQPESVCWDCPRGCRSSSAAAPDRVDRLPMPVPEAL